MKKLKLNAEDLAVSSFATEEKPGAVHANQVNPTRTRESVCQTVLEGCYPSLYCSVPHGCIITHQETCWTNENEYCPIGTGPQPC